HLLRESLAAALGQHLGVRERDRVAGAAVVDPADELAVDAQLVAPGVGIVDYARLHEGTLPGSVGAVPSRVVPVLVSGARAADGARRGLHRAPSRTAAGGSGRPTRDPAARDG